VSHGAATLRELCRAVFPEPQTIDSFPASAFTADEDDAKDDDNSNNNSTNDRITAGQVNNRTNNELKALVENLSLVASQPGSTGKK
jgi:hypothetical protein